MKFTNENVEKCIYLQGVSNQVTLCNTDRLQKPIVAKVNKEFPTNCGTRKFIIIIIIIGGFHRCFSMRSFVESEVDCIKASSKRR